MYSPALYRNTILSVLFRAFWPSFVVQLGINVANDDIMHRDVLVFVVATILNSRACRPGPTSFLVRHEEKFLDRTRLGPTSYQIGTRGSRIRTSSSDLVSSSPQKQNFGDDEPSSVKFGRRTDHFASFFSEQKPSLNMSHTMSRRKAINSQCVV